MVREINGTRHHAKKSGISTVNQSNAISKNKSKFINNLVSNDREIINNQYRLTDLQRAFAFTEILSKPKSLNKGCKK